MPDIPSALKLIKARYGKRKLVEIAEVLHAILRNIVENPSEQRFRRVDLSSQYFKSRLEPYIGVHAIFRILMFQRSGPNLIFSPADVSSLQEEMLKLSKVIRLQSKSYLIFYSNHW